MDPVDVAWGPDGTMWVVEMADYPIGIDNKDKPGSRVVAIMIRMGTANTTSGQSPMGSRLARYLGGTEFLPAPPSICPCKILTVASRSERSALRGLRCGNEQHRGNGLFGDWMVGSTWPMETVGYDPLDSFREDAQSFASI